MFCCCETYVVPEGVGSDWILSCQRAAAEYDEDEDEVGEDVVVDEMVTGHTDTGDRNRGSINEHIHAIKPMFGPATTVNSFPSGFISMGPLRPDTTKTQQHNQNVISYIRWH